MGRTTPPAPGAPKPSYNPQIEPSLNPAAADPPAMAGRSGRMGKRLSLNQALSMAFAQQAKARRPDLSQEQIEIAWKKFVSHSLNKRIRHESVLADWQLWIEREHGGKVVPFGQASRNSHPVDLADQLENVHYGTQL